jgi:hypothetical protein
VLARVHLVATAVWSVLAAGAGAGFVARDALGLQQPLVALAWTIGALLALLPFARWRSRRRRPGRRGAERGGLDHGERGQAAVEVAALVLLAALALGALAAMGPRFDGRSFAGFLAFGLVCGPVDPSTPARAIPPVRRCVDERSRRSRQALLHRRGRSRLIP